MKKNRKTPTPEKARPGPVKGTKGMAPPKQPARGKKNTTNAKTSEIPFPIIGIGASAGGLEAFELFFKTMPAESGMAFVLVPHLDPGHASMLSEILQRNTTMPVHEAADQTVVLPDHVYIIPPNKDMAIFNGTLQLSDPEPIRGLRLPIDAFFRRLPKTRAIGRSVSSSRAADLTVPSGSGQSTGWAGSPSCRNPQRQNMTACLPAQFRAVLPRTFSRSKRSCNSWSVM